MDKQGFRLDILQNWTVETDEEDYKRITKFIIVRQNKDQSRDVITKDGGICRVPPNTTIDSVCGPLVVVETSKLMERE